MLFPGLGFAGGTLARDAQTLRGLGDRFGIDTPLLDGAWQSNQLQNKGVVRRLVSLLGGSLQGRRISVLGLTYKPDTSTLRRSAALEVVDDLVRAGASVSASDPKADRKELAKHGEFVFESLPMDAVSDADAVVLMTPWADFKHLDFGAVKAAMRGDLIFDTANLWSADVVVSAGLRYVSIGRGRAE